ncbi:MAG: family transposase [Pseudonocardia sp.]|nr:family transposase [Pseudonocardia sp.]
MHLTSQNAIVEDRKLTGAGAPLPCKVLRANQLELVGDDDRLVGFAGALPLRLLAERTGLRARLSRAMVRRGFDPVYDRGQVLIDLAVTQVLGGEAISDFQGLRHLIPVIGPVPSTSTVWRALSEIGELRLARLNTAVTTFRRHWWGLLVARPEGFPWLTVAGRELTGIIVVDLDASIVFASSETLLVNSIRPPGRVRDGRGGWFWSGPGRARRSQPGDVDHGRQPVRRRCRDRLQAGSTLSPASSRRLRSRARRSPEHAARKPCLNLGRP